MEVPVGGGGGAVGRGDRGYPGGRGERGSHAVAVAVLVNLFEKRRKTLNLTNTNENGLKSLREYVPVWC